MAAANEQIGIAQAAYYPTLSLSAVAGFAGTSAINWFSWPSRFFAVGPRYRRRSLITAAGAPPPTSPSRSTMAPLPPIARPRSPHSSRLRTT